MQTDVALYVRQIVGTMIVKVQSRPRPESQPPRYFLPTKFRSQYYLHLSSYVYCICTFITNIYVALVPYAHYSVK
jgi:hypothetical protein